MDNLKREMIGESSWFDIGMLPSHINDKFDQLWKLHPEEHGEVIIYGKSIPIPRYQRSYGRDYKFSGTVSKGYPLPNEFKEYVDFANSLGYGEFNEILVNWYIDGNSYIGSHSDDEKQLKPGSPIVTITLAQPGESRKFRIRNKKTKDIVKDILTPNRMILTMGGDFQKEFKHEIVKTAKKVGSRISITLRQFVL